MTFGEKLQELRTKRSMSQESFAEVMNVSRQSVSKWELNQSYPEMAKMIEICDYFDVSLDSMTRGKSEDPCDSDRSNEIQSTDEEEKKTKEKKFSFDKMFILIAMALVMTAFRFVMTGDINRSILLVSIAGLIGVGLFVSKKFLEK